MFRGAPRQYWLRGPGTATGTGRGGAQGLEGGGQPFDLFAELIDGLLAEPGIGSPVPAGVIWRVPGIEGVDDDRRMIGRAGFPAS